MDETNIFKLNNCRICFSSDNLLNLNTVIGKGTNYEELLNYVVPEVVWCSDNFPSNICEKCTNKLEISSNFKLLCILSNMKRKKHISNLICVKTKDKLLFENLDNIPIILQEEIAAEKINEVVQSNDLSSNPEENVKKQRNQYTIKCFECDRIFKKVTSFRMHYTKVHEKNKDKPSNYILRKLNLNYKRKTTSPVKPFCVECKRLFSSTQNLKNHILSAHKHEKPFNCNICDENFTTKVNLKRHKKKHSSIREFICQYCGKEFFTNDNLSHHLRTHYKNILYECNMCDKKYFSSNGLLLHKQIKHSVKRNKLHLCQFCGYHTISISVLKIHLKRHGNIKNHACLICDKKFVTKVERNRHEQRHSNAPNFSCKKCDKTFTFKDNFQSHMKKVHKSIVKVPGNLGCSICSKMCETNYELKLHEHSHKKNKVNCHLLCKICDKRFNSQIALRTHLRNVHEVSIGYKSFVKEIFKSQ